MEPLVVDAPEGSRLDRVVAAALPALSRRQVRALFDEGRVLVIDAHGRRRARRGERSEGGTVEVRVDHPSDAAEPDPSISLCVVLEREDFVVIDKPPGMPSAPVHPGERGTVANGLVARWPEMAAVGFRRREPGLCHRLDTQTSGLLLAARTPAAFDGARAAITEGSLEKSYLLVCAADALPDEGTIELSLASRGDRVVVDDSGREVTTRFEVQRRVGGRALVEAHAAGAFRHQLRVHFAAIGAPLCGDDLYGGEALPGSSRHALHASRLSFVGDETFSAFDVRSPLPADLAALL